MAMNLRETMICRLVLLLSMTLMVISECDDVYIELADIDSEEFILAPNYPNRYPRLQDCMYRITGKPGFKLRVEFEEFFIENRDMGFCVYDWVEFFDGPTDQDRHLGRFCGKVKPSVVVSTTENMLVIFASDEAVQPGTFKARITIVPLSYQETYELGQCGGLMTDVEGGFSSPGYPYGYEAYEYCIYTISVNTDVTLQLHFTTFDIETHTSCGFDYVLVLDGDDTKRSPIIGTYCGGDHRPPQIMHSTGNSMTIIFSSDISLHYEGFYAKFAISEIGFPDLPPEDAPESNRIAMCDLSRAIVTQRSGVIVSHENYPDGQYPNYAQCAMVIIAERLYEKVYISFENVHLASTPTRAGVCEAGSGDYIEVIDGDLNLSLFNPTLLGRLCGGQQKSFVSAFMYLQLQFITDSVPSENHTGFEAHFTIFYEDPHGCMIGDFQCRNNRCIADFLVCDGYNNCGDNTDEDVGCGLENPDGDTNSGNQPGSRVGMKVGLTIGISVAIGAIVMAAACLVAIKIHSKKAQRAMSTTRLTDIANIGRTDRSNTPPVIGHDNPIYNIHVDEQAPPAPPKYSEIAIYQPPQNPSSNFFSTPAQLPTEGAIGAAAAGATAPPNEEKDESFLNSGDYIEAMAAPPPQHQAPLSETNPLPSLRRGGANPLPPLNRSAPLTVDLPSREVLYSNDATRVDEQGGLPALSVLRRGGTLPPISNAPPPSHSDC